MGRSLFLCLTALMVLIPGSMLRGQESFQDLSSILELDATLKTVSTDPDFLEKLHSEESLVLFTGTIAGRRVINGEEEEFVGEIELIDGEWHGTSSVSMYKSILRLEGPEYYASIPQKRSRRRDPREILPNTRYLVIGRVIDLREEEAEKLPVVRVLYLRQI